MKVTKKNFKLAAETKSLADFALVIQLSQGLSKTKSIEVAMEQMDTSGLYKKFLERNIQLFKTGDIVMI